MSDERVKVQPIDYLKYGPSSADDRDDDLADLDDPNVGNPGRDAGDDTPDQRPITDNKAGG
jgi:hypothetical protein